MPPRKPLPRLKLTKKEQEKLQQKLPPRLRLKPKLLLKSRERQKPPRSRRRERKKWLMLETISNHYERN